MGEKEHVVTVKVDTDTRDRIREAGNTLNKVYPQFVLHRSNVIREILKRGLADIEAEANGNQV